MFFFKIISCNGSCVSAMPCPVAAVLQIVQTPWWQLSQLNVGNNNNNGESFYRAISGQSQALRALQTQLMTENILVALWS